jgi:hypothetical protein
MGNAQQIGLGIVCLCSLCFMLWFLAALFFDAKKTPSKQVRVLILRQNARTKSRRTVTANLFEPTHRRFASAKIVGLASRRNIARPAELTTAAQELQVLRLADKHTDSSMKLRWLIMTLLLSASLRLSAQTSSTPAPTPLSTPSITGPLQAAPPFVFDAGPLGKLGLNGVVSGMGLVQQNHVSGDGVVQAALTNGEVFIQKTDGWWQFYVQAGAYNILALGTPFIPTDKAITGLYGPVPLALVKVVPAKNSSIQIGELPTLMGAEYTFDFENMNIQRGLLWNQENAITRGIQLNQRLGKFTASISWNDGYYLNRYSGLSGSLNYTKGPHSSTFVAMGNLSQTKRQTLATPIQNNGSMYAMIYTYTKGNWIVQPYYQYGSVPTNLAVGVVHGASTNGEALLVSRTFKHGLSLAGRGEYIASTGRVAEDAVNLLYGPGSGAFSITATPTFQKERFFARGDISFVHATNITPGDVFGNTGMDSNEARLIAELGFLF